MKVTHWTWGEPVGSPMSGDTWTLCGRAVRDERAEMAPMTRTEPVPGRACKDCIREWARVAGVAYIGRDKVEA